MDLQQRAAIEAACQYLTSSCCHYIDRGEARNGERLSLADIIQPDGLIP